MSRFLLRLKNHYTTPEGVNPILFYALRTNNFLMGSGFVTGMVYYKKELIVDRILPSLLLAGMIPLIILPRCVFSLVRETEMKIRGKEVSKYDSTAHYIKSLYVGRNV